MYSVYLITTDTKLVPETIRFKSPKKVDAVKFFDNLVNREDFDYQNLAAVLRYKDEIVARHDYMSSIGWSDYWRGRVNDLILPKQGGRRAGAGAPTKSNSLKNFVHVRVSAKQKQRFEQLGGAAWLRKQLEKSSED